MAETSQNQPERTTPRRRDSFGAIICPTCGAHSQSVLMRLGKPDHYEPCGHEAPRYRDSLPCARCNHPRHEHYQSHHVCQVCQDAGKRCVAFEEADRG